jgi:hypothetical protein
MVFRRLRRIAPSTVLLALALAAPSPAAEPPPRPPVEAVPAPVVNGVLTWHDPSVAILGTGQGLCSAVLVGCRTALTAAHCVCPNLQAEGCVDDPELTDPGRFTLFFQHAGFFGVTRVAVPPDFVFEEGHDVAVLELAEPVTGIRPVEVGSLPGAPAGHEVFFVGFGESDGAANDIGMKRLGGGTTVACDTVPEPTHICLEHAEPVGEPGEDSSTCLGDSGGPLLFGDRASPLVVGVASGADDLVCRPPHGSYFTELAADQAWLAAAAGPDLGSQGCSDLPAVGEPGAQVVQGEGAVDFAAPQKSFSFEVPHGTRELRVGVNGEAGKGNVDLYLRSGAPATPEAFDCAGERPTPFEHCRVASPAPGTWHALVVRRAGSPRFQVTATLFGEEPGPPGPPPPPAGPWLTSPEVPGFRAKARITPDGHGPLAGEATVDCIAETLCVEGALAGRPEAFLKVIGPRPNGYLWVQISRFTPSAIELWIEQLSTGELRYYRLPTVGPGDPDVSGLQDRMAFLPSP